MPFWKGEGVGRPFELGEKIGRASRALVALSDEKATASLRAFHLDGAPPGTSWHSCASRSATPRYRLDKTVVVERFRDEIGDGMCILTPFGARACHTPWAMALAARLRDTLGLEVQIDLVDDGIALRLPEPTPPSLADARGPEEIEDLVVQEVGQTALFGARSARTRRGRS